MPMRERIDSTAPGTSPVSVFVSTGSTSSDLLVEPLLRELQVRGIVGEMAGLGGSRLRDLGVSLFFDTTSLSSIGFGAALVATLGKLGAIRDVSRRIDEYFRTVRPGLVILVDNAGINLHILQCAHRHGLRTLYYVPPELWSLWKWQVGPLVSQTFQVAALLRSEAEGYRARGANAAWVGHPLVDLLADVPRPPPQLGPVPTIGLFPGSRRQEVLELLPILGQAAQILRRQEPLARFIVCIANDLVGPLVAREVAQWPVAVEMVWGQSHSVLGRSDLILACSGTVTQEAAIFGVPMVVLYRVRHWLDRLIGYCVWWRGGFPFFAMPNVMLNREAVPELLQREVTPDRVAEEAMKLLRNPDKREQVLAGLAEVRDLLGPPGAVRRTADLVEAMLERPLGPQPLSAGQEAVTTYEG